MNNKFQPFDVSFNYYSGQGRGFNTVGAHAPNYNDKSIGIVLIGDWRSIYWFYCCSLIFRNFNSKNIFLILSTDEVPPQNMLNATRELIDYAINHGYLTSTYTMYGHRQVRSTECPGDALFNEIKTWPHFRLNVTRLS